MTKNYFALLALWATTLFSPAFSQNPASCKPSAVKKSMKYYEDAERLNQSRESFVKIKELLVKSIEEDSTNGNAWWLYGDIALQFHKDAEMATAYEALIRFCPDASSDAYYHLGDYYYNQKRFKECIRLFDEYLSFGKVREEYASDAALKKVRAKLMMNPVPFNPTALKSVSTGDPEYLAIISPDNELCFFTRRFDENRKGAVTVSNVEKFMIAEKKDGAFTKGEPMPYPFNKSTSGNEGGASISVDNKSLFFTVNKGGNFDIYTCENNNGTWTEPESVSPLVNDAKYWDSQPSISPNGKALYFVSYRDAVNKTSDIYVTQKLVGSGWTAPSKLPKFINTVGNEKTPFMHPDNRTFYFSSDNLPGMGGFDIYMCKLKSDGTWSEPINIGYPINTEADEVGFFVSTDGKKGYFASNSLKGVGGYDIYEFDLPETVKPDKVLFLKGEIEGDKSELANAKIELKNVKTKETVEVKVDSITGKYASVVAFDDDYILTVKKEGLAYNSQYFSKKDSTLNQPKKVNLEVKKIEVGKTYQLNNILFSTNSSELNQQDKDIIEDFSDYLKINKSLKVSIEGHTDNAGNPQENQKLSEERASEVLNYLTQQGIDKSRLTSKGFGATKPKADNDTEVNMAKNRRTEFVIIGK
jgi:outer membrane protein OmpA-like peptidoglycan-associated protein